MAASKHEIFMGWQEKKWEAKHKAHHESSNNDAWPWHSEILDYDYEIVLQKYLPDTNLTICDVGTCAGWHAIELAKLGHSVVGTDISETVIEKAKENSIQFENIDVKFIKDDVLKSFLKSEQFDLITDRGTFHSMHGFRIPSITELYINTVKRLLKPGGIFMIKGMSIDEKRFNVGHFEELSELRIKSQMPYHFGPHELVETFNSDMEFIENWQSVFQTQNLKDPAIAEVAVFKNVNNGEI